LAVSIRVRVALVYAAVLACILLCFGVLLYTAVHHYLAAQIDESVAELAQHFAVALPPKVELNAESVAMAAIDPFASPGMHVQVLNSSGEPILHSAGLGMRALPSSDADLRLALLGVATYYTANAGDERIRIYNLPLQQGGNTVGVVQVGKSYHDFDLTLTQLSQATVAGGVLAIALAALAGWAVAGGALMPIADIAATARAIALSQGFSRRLPTQKKGDEVDRLASAFNDMLASLESAYKSQRRFVADASHELRAPLTTVIGNLEFVRRTKELASEERDAALDDALAEAQRMGRLVGDLLSLARADTSQYMTMGPVELGEIVRELWAETSIRAEGRQLHLEAAAAVTVWGDRDRLKQVALALVDNALKYTPAGGVVTVTVSAAAGRCTLAVRDTGIGIAPGALPHVFERFYRGAPAEGRERGAGLGLAIARWIADAHGAQIAIQSEVGRGTEVTLRFPAAVSSP